MSHQSSPFVRLAKQQKPAPLSQRQLQSGHFPKQQTTQASVMLHVTLNLDHCLKLVKRVLFAKHWI